MIVLFVQLLIVCYFSEESVQPDYDIVERESVATSEALSEISTLPTRSEHMRNELRIRFYKNRQEAIRIKQETESKNKTVKDDTTSQSEFHRVESLTPDRGYCQNSHKVDESKSSATESKKSPPDENPSSASTKEAAKFGNVSSAVKTKAEVDFHTVTHGHDPG